MQAALLSMLAAGLLLGASPCFAETSRGEAPAGRNAAVHDWNFKAFSRRPPANTNAFAARGPANTGAFAVRPPANTKAFGASGSGNEITAFGSGSGPTTNAFGNTTAATNNARRLANSFGTGNDHGASPIGSHLGPAAHQAIGGSK